jgi:hypothetical protein
MPPVMHGMSDEVRKQDDALFTEALNNYNGNAASPVLNNAANHELARLRAAQTYAYLQPFNPFSADVYAAVLVRCGSEMEHQAPPATRQRDDSGDPRRNSRNSQANAGISLADLGVVKRKADAQKELTGLRQEQRVGVLSPEKSARVAELQGILDDRGLAPIQKTELVPLDINASNQELQRASLDQVRDVMTRRKKEGWVQP